MKFNLSTLAVKEKSVTLFLILAVALSGVLAFLSLGRAEDPPYTIKLMTISLLWPGATAKEMEELVAEPIEKRLQELLWYDRVETEARPGFVVMSLVLRDPIPPKLVPEQFYQARKKIGDEARKLPQGVIGPFMNDEYSEVTFALYSIEAHGMPPRALTRQAEAVRQRLLHVPGVKKVTIMGERPETIFVEFTYQKLMTLGVNARDIFAALNTQNVLTPAGSVQTKGAQIYLRLDGAFNDIDAIKNTPIISNGRTQKLSEIATVRRGYEDPPTFLTRRNGEPCLLLNVFMQDTWNGLELGKSLEAEEAKISKNLPFGVSFNKVTDQAVNIKEAVGEFMLKFVVALVVVIIVSLLSLGWRVGIVVAAAVPLTLAGVFVVMMMTDRLFDRISLGALILALGLLVDDAIIAIEIMVVRMEEGLSRIEAAGYAWSHSAAPMLSGTLVTIIGLMPVGFAKSSAGEYAGAIFWIVAIALIMSWIVAVAFTPYLGLALLPKIEAQHGHNVYGTPMYERFRKIVKWTVHHKFVTLGIVIGLFVAAIFGTTAVNQQFFPSSDRPELILEVTLPHGAGFKNTLEATEKLEKWLKKQPDALITTNYVGAGAARFFFAYNPELPNPNFAKVIILTPNAKKRDELRTKLRQALADGLVPEARVRVTQLVFGPYVQWLTAFRILGPDPKVVRSIADKVEAIFRANPNTRTINQDWHERTPIFRFKFDQNRLQLIGLTSQDAAEQLQFLLIGASVTQQREDIRSVDIVCRALSDARLDPGKLKNLTLTTKSGQLIPITQIGTVSVDSEDYYIKRRDKTPCITVACDVDESCLPPMVSAQLEKALQPLMASLPDGYRIETGGIVEESMKANKALAAVFPIMLMLMMTVIMIQVRSFAALGMVLLTAPLGLIGVVPILLLFHQPFGWCAILGSIALAGILMRNTLILIGQIHNNEHEGLDQYEAVIEATVQRSRPVLLTALAAVLAFTPLTQSVFWGPMAYTLIGGTAVGTVLTLTFLPALYALWFRISDPRKGSKAGSAVSGNTQGTTDGGETIAAQDSNKGIH